MEYVQLIMAEYEVAVRCVMWCDVVVVVMWWWWSGVMFLMAEYRGCCT